MADGRREGGDDLLPDGDVLTETEENRSGSLWFYFFFAGKLKLADR